MNFKLTFLCTIFFFGTRSMVVKSYELSSKQAATDTPYYVGVSGGTYFCGGILISVNYIITPAECVQGSTTVIVYLGFYEAPHDEDEDPPEPQQIIYDNEIILHEDFSMLGNRHYINNIALVKLSQSARLSDYVRPGKFISRQEQYPLEGTFANITGWSLFNYDHKETALVEIISQDKYRYIFEDHISPSQALCFRYFFKTQESSNLHGNVISVISINDKILGLIKTCPVCFISRPGCNETYTIVNIVPFLDWISSKTNIPVEELCGNKEIIDISELNKKIENILVEITNIKTEHNTLAQFHNKQISDIFTQINDNKNKAEKCINNIQAEQQQSIDDLEKKFNDSNDTVNGQHMIL